MNSVININEFFSGHYLADMLPKDVEPLLKGWKAQADAANEGLPKRIHRTPVERIGGLRAAWESARRAAADGSDSSWETWYSRLLPVLGYTLQPTDFTVRPRAGEEFTLPVLLARPEVHPRLLMVRLPDEGDEDEPFQSVEPVSGLPWAKVLDAVFSMEDAPRRVLCLRKGGATLLDSAKWHEKSLLRFDFSQLYFEPEKSMERQVFPALLHADTLCPADPSSCLMDELEANSHRNAFSVTEELKDALRECIELLGNEYVYDRRRQKQAVYRCPAGVLADECLRYMYRLLFCFYLEACSKDLGFLQVDNETYRGGYSLEMLRDMEQVPLETEEERNGYFFSDSIQRLFSLIYNGRKVLATGQGRIGEDFEIPALKSHLFDPSKTPHINNLRVRNATMQRIIRLMSLGRQGKRTGRISYSRLGLNQLGAVYENLLGYSAFFAREPLYEVKPEKDKKFDPKQHAFFITERDIKDYTGKEQVLDADGGLVRHEPGEFIYRMAGRNRKNSASYYTPESLTRTTVRYALQELLPGMPADDILKLKVCEPAVGSAAFLNEAINQLADAYLQRKQAETGMDLAPEDYHRERQRCKMYIADRNVVGVDLNGTAIELAEVSLWLNSIYKGAFVPWFGMQLFHGNSLVGAGRQCLPASSLGGKRAGRTPLPYDHRSRRRPDGSVYHWLVPDEGMAAAATSKVLAEMCPEQVQAMKSWRKDFLRPFTELEIQAVLNLSDVADRLWLRVEEDLARFERETADPLTVWPAPEAEAQSVTPLEVKDRRLSILLHAPDSAFRRLQLAMDYWCALWFWRPEDADLLPTLDEFLTEMGTILSGPVPDAQGSHLLEGLFAEDGADPLAERVPRLDIVRKLAEKHRFFHWELSCAGIFRERGGFDLILGNPPWVKLEFEESGLLGEYDPRLAIRKVPADMVARRRDALFLEHEELRGVYAEELTGCVATGEVLSSTALYPLLEKQPPNLYKNFITRAWEVAAPKHAIGFLHPDGVFDYPKGGLLRSALYPRLRHHFHFANKKNLFAEVASVLTFSVNIYAPPQGTVAFDSAYNLCDPKEIDDMYRDGGGILRVTPAEMAVFARLLDGAGASWRCARLPRVQSATLMESILKLAEYPATLADIRDRLSSTECWNETGARKDGTIRRETCFPESGRDVILSAPHFYTANPLYKTPRAVCKEKSDYDVLPLDLIPDDYIPRVNYVAQCGPDEYRRRTPALPWDGERKITDCYKVAFRQMAQPGNEHTLIAALVRAGTAHVNAVRSVAAGCNADLLAMAAVMQSLVGDFYLKITGATNIHYQWLNLPLLPHNPLYFSRVLALNCLTQDYAPLWREVWSDALPLQQWYGDDPRLPRDFWRNLTPEWRRDCSLRSDFARRWALCELDVMVAREIGWTLEELCEAYRIQFPVLRKNEADTWYDRNGRIVYTCSMGLKGVGLSPQRFEEVRHAGEGESVLWTWTDDTRPGGPVQRTTVYEAPFDRRDRETDYAVIWAALDAASAKA